MLCDFCSDLHIDNYTQKPFIGIASVDFARLKNPGSRVLIIAGDTANHHRRLFKLLKKALPFYERIVFLDGNHEHYDSKRPIPMVERRMREFCQRHPSVVYLDGRASLRIDDLAIIGANGWYDWKLMSPEISEDDQFVAWTGERPAWFTGTSWDRNKHGLNDRDILSRDEPVAHVIRERAKHAVTMLKRQVEHFSADANVRSIIVVTHTAPARFCLDERPWDMDYQRLSGSYGNSGFQEVLAVPHHKIKIWHYGHTHRRRFLPHPNGVIFLNNARGRPSEQARLGSPFAFVQLDSSGL